MAALVGSECFCRMSDDAAGRRACRSGPWAFREPAKPALRALVPGRRWQDIRPDRAVQPCGVVVRRNRSQPAGRGRRPHDHLIAILT